MSEKFTKMQPKDGDTVLHCGHLDSKPHHFFALSDGKSIAGSARRASDYTPTNQNAVCEQMQLGLAMSQQLRRTSSERPPPERERAHREERRLSGTN